MGSTNRPPTAQERAREIAAAAAVRGRSRARLAAGRERALVADALAERQRATVDWYQRYGIPAMTEPESAPPGEGAAEAVTSESSDRQD